jgi:Tfp pilus assembly protein PilF
MTPVTLHTLGRVRLGSGQRDGLHDDPRLVALLVLLGVAGDRGMSGDDLLLYLAPDETTESARLELVRLLAAASRVLECESAVVRTTDGFALRPGLMSLDVRVLPDAAPEECVGFLAGFTLRGSPEFDEWLVALRSRVAPISTERRWPRPRIKARTLRRGLTVVAISTAVIAAGAYMDEHRPESDFAIGDPILVSDIQNETGDSLLGSGLMSAASVALQQSGRLRLYSRTRLREVYALMQITNRDTALTFDLAKEVAQRDDVRFVLGLQVARLDDGYRLTGHLADVAAPDRSTQANAVARTKADVLAALEEVVLAVRARLGESRQEIEERRSALPYVTTPSLDALRSYGDGAVAWSKGEYRLAKELWLRAVDIDTGFAMAYGALAGSYYFTHERDEGERYYAEAFKRSSRLSDHEMLRLKQKWFGDRGRTDSAIVYAGRLAERYPSVITWYNYGSNLMRGQRDAEASLALQKALTYDPRHVSSYINLATVMLGHDALDSALMFYTHADRVDSTALYHSNINHEYGSTLVKLGRLAEAESAFSRMSREPRVDSRALGFRSLGYLALWRGRTDDAIEFYRRAAAASKQQGSPLSESRNRMLLATAYHTAGRNRESNEEISRAMAMVAAPSLPPQVLAMLATNAFKLGRATDVRSLLATIRARKQAGNRVDAASEAYVAGLSALMAGHMESALHHARAAVALPTTIQRLMLEAEALRGLGHVDSALMAVRAVEEQRGFGFEGQDDWLRAPLVLGDLMLARHDTVGAVKEYQRLLARWRSAPTHYMDAVTGRARLAALRSGEQDQPRR